MVRMRVSDLRRFATEEFGGCRLGDTRLNRRLGLVVARLAADPARSLPQAMGHWSQAKAAYRFFANDDVTREKVLEPHFVATAGRLAALDTVLVVQDSTTLNYSHHPETEGLGHIGTRKRREPIRGVVLHSTLAVAPGTHEALGLLAQQVLVRADDFRTCRETSKQTRARPRESQKWADGVRAVVARAGQAARLVFVFDREGDIFEAIEQIQDLGARFVIRANYNRLLATADGDRRYLLDAVRTAPIVARVTVPVPAGGGRQARAAALTLRAGHYAIRPPSDRQRRGAPREVNLLWIVEDQPPAGVAALAWALLTSEPVATAEAATMVARHYCGRWKIEEWHKALKTGCKVEDRQLAHWERLDVLLGILSVIAWRLLGLRDAARTDGHVPAEVLVDAERAILRQLEPTLLRDAPARAYLRAIGKLGGFLARRSDGDPGWMSLWRGYARLTDMRLGYLAAKGPERCG